MGWILGYREYARLGEAALAICRRLWPGISTTRQFSSAPTWPELNATLRSDLEKKGLVFNAPPNEPFRDALRKAGFYVEWKQKYGADAWAILERYSGKLA